MDRMVDGLQLPSYAHLNRAQKRIFIIRDELKFLEPLHLDTHLKGINNESEPPNYRAVNGKIEPPLVEITLKESAAQVDLGNVRFLEANRGVIRRVHLFIEDGNCEMKEDEPLPKEEDSLASVPIDVYLIKSTVTLFQAKHEAIVSRCRQLNELRRCAYDGAKKAKAEVEKVGEGKSLAKVNIDGFSAAVADINSSNETPYRARLSGEPVHRHMANKRKRIGFNQVPDNLKCTVFGSIPEQLKINLFDTLLKTAMPKFDDLMMACWNVAHVYEHTGSDCAELHRVVAQMVEVLAEFDEDFHRSDRKKKIAKDIRDRRIAPQNGREAANPNIRTPMESKTPAGPIVAAGTRGDVEGGEQQSRLQSQALQAFRDDENVEQENSAKEAQYDRSMDSRCSDGLHPPRYQDQNALVAAARARRRAQARGAQARGEQTMDQHSAYNNGGPGFGAPYPLGSYGPHPYYAQDHYAAHPYYGYSNEPEQRQFSIQDVQHKRKEVQERRLRSVSQNGHRTSGKSTQEDSRQIETDGATDQNMDDTFEEQRDQEKADEVRKEMLPHHGEREHPAAPVKGVFLGQSKLGAPKNPQVGTVRAPVAPMMSGQRSPTAPMMQNRQPR